LKGCSFDSGNLVRSQESDAFTVRFDRFLHLVCRCAVQNCGKGEDCAPCLVVYTSLLERGAIRQNLTLLCHWQGIPRLMISSFKFISV